MRVVAIVVAAGSGERLGADVPKAFVELAGRPMVAWSLAALAEAGLGDGVVVAVPAGYASAVDGSDRASAAASSAVGAIPGLERWYGANGRGGTAGERARWIAGGATRSDSVARALAALADVEADAVIVHDAARPLVPPALFASVLAALEDADAATAAAPMTDTVKEAGADRAVVGTLDRSRLWAVQTPQAFRREALERALNAGADALAVATDDCSLVEALGGRVVVVPGPPENFKVTTPHDRQVADLLLRARSGGAS